MVRYTNIMLLHTLKVIYAYNNRLQWSTGSVLAFGTQVRGFKPGRSRRIFRGEKILSMPSFGGEVKPSVPCRRFAACKRSLHLLWKSHAVGKIGSAISRPYFPPSLIEVSHVAGCGASLEMTGKLKSVHKRPVRKV